MHFCNASCTILANYACINWSMLDKKQGVHSVFFDFASSPLLFRGGTA